jgi:phage terminase large subunit-like protein
MTGEHAAVGGNPVDAYAHAVVSGRLLAGKYHRLACERHIRDRARENTPGFPYRFDLEQAERFFRFSAKLKHYKGRQFAGQPVVLSPVQRFRLGSVFGWRHVETGLRRFTTAYNELPRKSGKSLEAAIVAVYVTFFEREAGAEGYCIATKRKQAEIVFGDAKRLVKASGLKSRITVNAKSLYHEKSASKLEALGADAETTDGLNPFLIITDEMHAMKSRDLIDVMESATGARVSFLHFQITTAGSDPVSVCGDQHDYATKILDGVLEEDESTVAFFAFIAHADEGDDWWDERTWQKANPHWGISVNPEDLRKLAAKAKNMPSAAAEFAQKRLNVWVNTDQPWLSIDGWKKGQVPDDRERWLESLERRQCFIGIDLSSKIDLAAIAALFPLEARRWALVVEAFTPADTLKERAHRDRAPYQRWVDEGWLRTIPGNRVDYDVILEALKALAKRYEVLGMGIDPWNAGNLISDAEKEGLDVPIVEVPYTFAHMSAPSKEWEADVLDGLVDANGNPLMTWCTSNAVTQKDGKDNILPIKKRSRGRIDPVVAAIIARKLAGVPEPEKQDETVEVWA